MRYLVQPLVLSYCLASIGYLIVWLVFVGMLGWPWVFAGLFRMFMYHEEHSFSYIAVICFVYALVATIAAFWFRRHQKRKTLVILSVIPITILLASIPGGILWTIHDMAAGHFLTGTRLFGYLAWGALTGLEAGWLIIALSVPYNLFGILISYFLTKHGFDQLMAKKAPAKPQ